MKILLKTIPALLLAMACGHELPEDIPSPERIPGIPEVVEAKLLDIVGRGWPELIDTLEYFNTYLLEEGKMSGFGPDSVWYELNMGDTMTFSIADSVHMTGIGTIVPLDMTIYARQTEILAQEAEADSIKVSTEGLQATFPGDFDANPDASAPFSLEGVPVGFVTKSDIEDECYISGSYYVFHYYGDPRTFALNESNRQ